MLRRPGRAAIAMARRQKWPKWPGPKSLRMRRKNRLPKGGKRPMVAMGLSSGAVARSRVSQPLTREGPSFWQDLCKCLVPDVGRPSAFTVSGEHDDLLVGE